MRKDLLYAFFQFVPFFNVKKKKEKYFLLCFISETRHIYLYTFKSLIPRYHTSNADSILYDIILI